MSLVVFSEIYNKFLKFFLWKFLNVFLSNFEVYLLFCSFAGEASVKSVIVCWPLLLLLAIATLISNFFLLGADF